MPFSPFVGSFCSSITSCLRYANDFMGIVRWYMRSICSRERPLVCGKHRFEFVQWNGCQVAYLRDAEESEDEAHCTRGTPDKEDIRFKAS